MRANLRLVDVQDIDGISVPAAAANDNAVAPVISLSEKPCLENFEEPHKEQLENSIKGTEKQLGNRHLSATIASDPVFTGKEEDVEVGLQYFGKRFLNPLLGRWVSADPLAVHAPGSADLNLYAYVHGTVLKAVDPLGLAEGEGGAPAADESDEDKPGDAEGSEGASSDTANGENEKSYTDPCGEGSCVLMDHAFEQEQRAEQRAELKEAWKETQDKRGLAKAITGFGGVADQFVLPLGPPPGTPPGIAQLAEGVAKEGVAASSQLTLDTADVTARVATTPLVLGVAGVSFAAVAPEALAGAGVMGASGSGFSALTSDASGVDLFRQVHSAGYTGFMVGGLTGTAGAVGTNALGLNTMVNGTPLVAANLGLNMSSGAAAYSTSQWFGGGAVSGGMTGLNAGVGGIVGGVVPMLVGANPFAQIAVSGILGGFAGAGVGGAF